jgi:hypothetical protein
VFFTLRFRVPAKVIPIDPRTQPLPDEVRRYFHDAYMALTGDGFELAGTMFLPDVVPNVRTLLALYVNRTTSDMAMSTFLLAEGGIESLKAKYVEFVTRFSDGAVVQTNNTREIGSFKPLPQEYTTQFWDIEDTSRLYQLHRFLAQKHGGARSPVCRVDSEFGGNAVQYVQRAVLNESFAEQVSTGYLARAPEGFRATIPGALIMAWQELWPLKALRRQHRKRQAQQVLDEFEAFGKRGV